MYRMIVSVLGRCIVGKIPNELGSFRMKSLESEIVLELTGRFHRKWPSSPRQFQSVKEITEPFSHFLR